MFILSLYILTFIIGLTIGFWIKGQFRDFFSSKVEYHLHMVTVLSTCILTFSTIIHYKQYLFL